MNLSFSYKTEKGDVYRISLENIPTELLSEEVREELGGNVEIVEVILDRLYGDNITDRKTLSLISEKIGRIFIESPNLILYYFCDDLHSVPNQRSSITPQEYRSRLFSAMFERFVKQRELKGVSDSQIYIDAVGWDIYLHLIYRDEHSDYIELLKNYIAENYTK